MLRSPRATWFDLGGIFGNVRAILGPFWEVLGAVLVHLTVLGLGFRVWCLGFDYHNAYPIEVMKSLSTGPCGAKMLD